MNLLNLKTEIKQLDSRWHKLIFVCESETSAQQIAQLYTDIKVLNLNLMICQGLMSTPKSAYPFYVEEIVHDVICDQSKIYLLEHIEVLFDPLLQIHPIRLLENISKRMKIIVIWPGMYKDGKLIYAENGHPEYFTSDDFEGKVITS